MLASAALEILGGMSSFWLARTPAADALSSPWGARAFFADFPRKPDWLRFGLPANERA
jgi:hypothetical protein